MTVVELIQWLNLHAEHEAEVFVVGKVQHQDMVYDIEVGGEELPFEVEIDDESGEVLFVLPKIDLTPRRFR